MSAPERRVSPKAAAVAAAVVAVVAALVLRAAPGSSSPLYALELLSLDARFRVRGERPPGDAVVVVALDDKTLQERPALLERRAELALLLNAIAAQRPRVIGIDAFFAEPEAPLPEALADDVRAFVDGDAFAQTPEPARGLLSRVRDEDRGDEALAAALVSARPVVLALHGDDEGSELDAEGRRAARFGQVGPGEVRAAPRLLSSLPSLVAAAGGAGLVTVLLDDDQTARRLAAARVHQGAVLTPLWLRLAAAHRGVAPAQVGLLPGEALVLGSVRVPLDVTPASADRDGDSALLLNFRGGAGAFVTLSAVDVVAGRVAAGALTDKVVLVGFSHRGHDVTPTPFAGDGAGVFLHTPPVDNVLRAGTPDGPLRRAPPGLDALVALLAGLSVAATQLRRRDGRALVPLAVRVAATALVPAAVVAAAYAALLSGLWLLVVAPVAAALSSSLVGFAVSGWSEGLSRRRLRRAFAHYLDDAIIEELLQNPAALGLGGVRRDVTLLFSDVRGFTALSEQLSPLQLTALLNQYLTPMTRAVLSQRGFVDKYIGDALMAVFGAPAVSSDHPDRALATVLLMHEALAALQPSLPVPLSIGVGLNTGEAVAGNMGSAERFDYTVIGDAVNLASRLEGLTKVYGVFCLVGETTKARASSPFSFREVDWVRVKGRQQPVAVYELVAGPGRAVAAYVDVDTFARGVSAWRRGDLKAARKAFAGFAEQNPADRVARLYLERLAALPDDAPPGWDGVVEHTHK